MKRAKRIKLYHWFEEDQKARTGSKLYEREGEREREREREMSKFHVIGHDNCSWTRRSYHAACSATPQK